MEHKNYSILSNFKSMTDIPPQSTYGIIYKYVYNNNTNIIIIIISGYFYDI